MKGKFRSVSLSFNLSFLSVSLLKWSQQTSVDQAETKIQELHLDLPHGHRHWRSNAILTAFRSPSLSVPYQRKWFRYCRLQKCLGNMGLQVYVGARTWNNMYEYLKECFLKQLKINFSSLFHEGISKHISGFISVNFLFDQLLTWFSKHFSDSVFPGDILSLEPVRHSPPLQTALSWESVVVLLRAWLSGNIENLHLDLL